MPSAHLYSPVTRAHRSVLALSHARRTRFLPSRTPSASTVPPFSQLRSVLANATAVHCLQAVFTPRGSSNLPG
eukprot:2109310-Prymnesium_polylepis.1